MMRTATSIPLEFFEGYENAPRQDLLKFLAEANQQLAKFGAVNTKAFDQLSVFADQRQGFVDRLATLEKEHDSILTLIDEKTEQKSSCLKKCVATASGHFSEIFALLVKKGRGRLSMKKDGLHVTVSFTGLEESARPMTSLSGGQKTMVALCLVFALQRVEVAPFYLFDEVDAALDGAFRKSLSRILQV